MAAYSPVSFKRCQWAAFVLHLSRSQFFRHPDSVPGIQGLSVVAPPVVTCHAFPRLVSKLRDSGRLFPASRSTDVTFLSPLGVSSIFPCRSCFALPVSAFCCVISAFSSCYLQRSQFFRHVLWGVACFCPVVCHVFFFCGLVNPTTMYCLRVSAPPPPFGLA